MTGWTWQYLHDRVQMLNRIGDMSDAEVHFVATSRWTDAASYERVVAAQQELERRGLNRYGRPSND